MKSILNETLQPKTKTFELPPSFGTTARELVACMARLAPDMSNPSVVSIESPVRLPPWIMEEFVEDLCGILEEVQEVWTPMTARVISSEVYQSETSQGSPVDEVLSIETTIEDFVDNPDDSRSYNPELNTNWKKLLETYEFMNRSPSDTSTIDSDEISRRHLVLSGFHQKPATRVATSADGSETLSSVASHLRRSSIEEIVSSSPRSTIRGVSREVAKPSAIEEMMRYQGSISSDPAHPRNRNCFSIAVIEKGSFSFYCYNVNVELLDELSAKLIQLGTHRH